MKPLHVVSVLTLAVAYTAVRILGGLNASAEEPTLTIRKVAADLNMVQTKLHVSEARLNAAKADEQRVGLFLKRWQEIEQVHNRIGEELKNLTPRFEVQPIRHTAIESSKENVRIADRDIPLQRRKYDFSGTLDDCVNHFGVFEKSFDLAQTYQVSLARKGDRVLMETIYVIPQFTSTQ